VFGVVTIGVESRRREIGIRLALGAARRDILCFAVGRTMQLVIGGLGIGATAVAAASRFLQPFLFGVSPTDALTVGATASLLLVLSIVAGYLPARRALRVDPVVTLRHE